MITVITPTYNRCNNLVDAYDSLINQSNKDFEWIIIDDGSIDNTKKLVNKFIKEKKINIRYYYKDNGGKHTALNLGIDKSSGDYIIILDSDDIFTNDAIECIYKYIDKYKNNKNICGFSFLRLDKNNNKIGKSFKEKELISNYIDFRHNRNIYGDMQEVYKTNILKKYKFPIFKKEKFLSEAIVWTKIGLNYDTVYINKGICICEYLSDGLSKNFFKLVYNNPVGAMENANCFLNKRYKLIIRIKNAILYDGYAFVAKKNIKNSNNRLLTTLFIPFGYLYKLFLIIKSREI